MHVEERIIYTNNTEKKKKRSRLKSLTYKIYSILRKILSESEPL